MSKKPTKKDSLRTAAEGKLARTKAPKQIPPPAEKLLHELQVHQIELQMQNEELHRNQAVIEEMNDRYVDLYELAPVGYLTLNRAGTISEVNLTGAALLGVERQELLNKYFARFVSPECVDPWTLHFRDVLRRDGRQSCELSLQRLDGSSFPAQITSLKTGDSLSSHISDDPPTHKDVLNKSISLRLVIIDITESNRVKNELLDSKNRLQSILDAIPDLLFDVGLDGRIHDYHSPRADLLAAPPEVFLGKKFSDVLPQDMADVCMSAIAEAHEKGFSIGKRYELQLAQGKFWFELSVSRKANSASPRFIVLARDITERMQMKRELSNFSTHILDAREEEKANIAREIHDDLGGTLLNLKLEANWLKTQLSENEKATPLLEHVESMSMKIDHAANVMRGIITGLRPPILDELGLLAALEWQAVQFHKHSGIKCGVNCVGNIGNLDKQRSSSLFRISQEALSNVAKHSGATSVEIEFFHNDEEVFMSITDNGRGIPEKCTDSSAHYGVSGMIERVKLLGGKISFPPTHATEGGFKVQVTLPLSARPEEAA